MTRPPRASAPGQRAGEDHPARHRGARTVVAVLATLVIVIVIVAVALWRQPSEGGSAGRRPTEQSGATTDAPPGRPPASVSDEARGGVASPPTTTARAPEHLDVSVIGAKLPAGLSRAAAVGDGSALVVLGGLASNHQSTAAVLRVDPTTGSTTALASLPIATHDAAAVRLGGSLLVFGGGAASVTDAVQQVDADGMARVVGHLPSPRADLRAVVVGDRAVIVGGYDGRRSLSTVVATSDGVHFSTVATLPRAVRYPALAAVGDKVYVFGGEDGATLVGDVQVVDVAAGTAALVGRLPEARGEAAAVVGGERVWVVGGRTSAGIVGSILRWDPSTGTATPDGDLGSPVADAAPVQIGDTSYLVGGEDVTAVTRIVATRPR